MKKSTIAAILFIAAVVGGVAYLWWGPPKLRLVTSGCIAAAFANDLHDFVLQNSGRLPSDWQEFEKWAMQIDGKNRWRAADSSKRLRILHAPYATVDGELRYIEVIEPDIKGMEAHINRMIALAQWESTQTNHAANHTSDQTNAPP